MTFAFALALAFGGDPLARFRPLPVHDPAPGYGLLHQPAYTLDKVQRPPVLPYVPQPGDVVLMSNPSPMSQRAYRLAGTDMPGHSGIVVRMPDGRLGMFEAGVDESAKMLISPLDYRLHAYPGTLWVRRRTTPLTCEQEALLTEFAVRSHGGRFSLVKFAAQLSPFRSRGRLRTEWVGRPRGPGRSYVCSEAVLEALVFACVLDAETTRPSATYPRDLFFDQSPIPFLNCHPPLRCGWEAPALWQRVCR